MAIDVHAYLGRKVLVRFSFTNSGPAHEKVVGEIEGELAYDESNHEYYLSEISFITFKSWEDAHYRQGGLLTIVLEGR